MRFALVGRCVCVVALGLRTASAYARVKPFGKRVRVQWFDSRASLLCRQRILGSAILASQKGSQKRLIPVFSLFIKNYVQTSILVEDQRLKR